MLVVTGYHGAGKTEIAKFFARQDFEHIDLGPTLRKIHEQNNPDVSFADWCRCGESEYGQNFTDIMLVENIRESFEQYKSSERELQDILITGSRSLKGINFLRNNLPSFNGKPLKIIHICAPEKLLKERYCKREGSELNDNQFQYVLNKDKILGIDTILGHEDYIVTNCGTLNDLDTVTQNLLKNIGYKYDDSVAKDYIERKIKSCKNKGERIDAVLKVDNKIKNIVAEQIREIGHEALVFEEIPYISAKLDICDVEEFLKLSDNRKRKYLTQKYGSDNIESLEFPSEFILRRIHKQHKSRLVKV